MMNSSRPRVYLIAAALSGGLLCATLSSGCSDDGTVLAASCPRGQVPDESGQCVTPGDTGRGRADAGGDVPSDTPVDTPIDTALPDTCTPSERACRDERTVAECVESGDGWDEIACAEGTFCDAGACVLEGNRCTPGEVLGCESTTQQQVCASNGRSTEARLCPEDAPNCDDGECTAQLCAPNARRCQGSAIVQCSEDGSSEAVVQPCEFGCSAGRCSDPCAADGKDYLGCAFWAADLDNISSGGGDVAQFAVTISNGTAREVSARVETGGGNLEWEGALAPGALQVVPLGPQNVNDSALSSNTYRITTDFPVTVHQFNPLNNEGVFSNDASLLLPATSVGREYIVNGWPTVTASSDLKAFVAIVAVAEGTTEVTVTSPIATLAGSGVAALRPRVPETFSMTQGQILSFTTGDTAAVGFTGMEILATQNVAVFSGSECANIPVDNNFCDHLEEQLFPVDTWGNQFVGGKFEPRGTEPDIWRVVAAEDGTNVMTNPVIPVVHGRTLGRGEYVEFVTDVNFVLTADKPVSLAQFMVGSAYPGPSGGCDLNGFRDVIRGCTIPRSCGSGTGIGDPAFLINVPTAQFRNDYLVLTPQQYAQNHFTIIARPGTTIRIDGTEVRAPRIDVAGWQVIRVPASAGVHKVEADQPIGLYAYGYDCDVSYAYPGGLNLTSL